MIRPCGMSNHADHALAFAKATMFTATRQQVGTANHITAHVDMLLHDTYGRNASPYSAAYYSVWLLGTAILQTESTETDDLGPYPWWPSA